MKTRHCIVRQQSKNIFWYEKAPPPSPNSNEIHNPPFWENKNKNKNKSKPKKKTTHHLDVLSCKHENHNSEMVLCISGVQCPHTPLN